jgi:hypothetical protein
VLLALGALEPGVELGLLLGELVELARPKRVDDAVTAMPITIAVNAIA